MMFNTAFNSILVISWHSVLLVEEDKNNMSPHQSGGDIIITTLLKVSVKTAPSMKLYSLILDDNASLGIIFMYPFIGSGIFFLQNLHTVCQRNSSETTEQNFMKLGR
jgi:hypothetical protein